MKTKDKVEYWLKKYPHLRDDDNRLCANIWDQEIKKFLFTESDYTSRHFFRLYAAGKLTPAPSIKRARAKLQEERPEYRGEKYYIRKGIAQDEWRKKLGYEVNK
tara:strand:+ start:72 stop:383 length:312 start_codon:yes stop_codon:yes gene_type:complete